MTSFSRILCVIDPTSDTQPALDRAAWLAMQTGAAIDLLICYYNEYLGGEWYSDSASLKSARLAVLDNMRDKLEALASPLRDEGLTVATNAIWYHPLHEGISSQVIALNSDVVFKDTHHHSALSRSFFSNSDWNLIRTCPAPVWLVKPTNFKDQPTFIAAVDPLNEHDKPAALDDEILLLSKGLAFDVGGSLHVFHSYDPRIALGTMTASAYAPVSLPLQEIEAELSRQHEKKLAEMVEFYDIPEERTHLISGIAHEELPELATELEAAVVVMGAVSRNKMKRAFIGATAERTLEHLPCDLLVVKPSWFGSGKELQVSDAA